MDHVLEERFLTELVATKHHRYTSQQAFFLHIWVFGFREVLAKELDGATVSQAILFDLNNSTIVNPIFCVPISSWGLQLCIFDFNNLT